MSRFTLYHIAPSRSSIVLWMMEEIGEPYNLHVLNGQRQEQREPDYLAINPMGKVPALRDGDTVITEAAAICAYLADEFPDRKLNIPVGTPARGLYLKWLFFGPGCIEPAVTDRAFPRKEEAGRGMLGYGDFDTVMHVLAAAVKNGPYLMGDAFTAADVVVGSHLHWATAFKLIPERPEFMAYLARFADRPALLRARARDAELGSA